MSPPTTTYHAKPHPPKQGEARSLPRTPSSRSRTLLLGSALLLLLCLMPLVPASASRAGVTGRRGARAPETKPAVSEGGANAGEDPVREAGAAGKATARPRLPRQAAAPGSVPAPTTTTTRPPSGTTTVAKSGSAASSSSSSSSGGGGGESGPLLPLASPTGRHYNFTLAFLTAVRDKGPSKFTAGAFFLALEHLNNLTHSRLNASGRSATFRYIFRDTLNLDTEATRAMVGLYCGDQHVSAFIGPDVFCNSAALLATSFDLPYLTFDCNDIHTLRTNIHKFLMVNLEPSLAYVAKSIVAVMEYYHWASFWLITGTGVTSNAWTDTGQELRHYAREAGITLTDVTREDLNDQYHTMRKNQKPYRTVVEETRYKTRVYVFLGGYNSLLEFLQELERAGVTSEGHHMVIAVDDRPLLGTDRTDQPGDSAYFLSTEETGKEVTAERLAAFRNVLLLSRQQSTPEITEEFRYHVYEKNYAPPINLKRIPTWWPGKKQHDLQQESVYLYDAVKHYGNVVMDLIENDQDPYNATLVSQHLRNVDIDSVQGFKVHINQDGESEGRYVVRSLAHGAQGQPVAQMWQVGAFSIRNGTTRYQPSNDTFVGWVSGQVPVSDPECGFDGSKCRDANAEMSEWKVIAVGIALALMVLLVIGAVFVGLRYWLMVRRMRRQALAAARVGCTNSFMELQEQDREGLLVC